MQPGPARSLPFPLGPRWHVQGCTRTRPPPFPSTCHPTRPVSLPRRAHSAHPESRTSYQPCTDLDSVLPSGLTVHVVTFSQGCPGHRRGSATSLTSSHQTPGARHPTPTPTQFLDIAKCPLGAKSMLYGSHMEPNHGDTNGLTVPKVLSSLTWPPLQRDRHSARPPRGPRRAWAKRGLELIPPSPHILNRED